MITLVWVIIEIFFIGKYSCIAGRKLNAEIEQLKGKISHYEKKCATQKIILKTLAKEAYLERFAREEYFMKKPNEEVFIIELDGTKE